MPVADDGELKTAKVWEKSAFRYHGNGVAYIGQFTGGCFSLLVCLITIGVAQLKDQKWVVCLETLYTDNLKYMSEQFSYGLRIL